eukprot:TRINITY_DN36037_c0_g1_i1.p1 TRINITY_DN36037_c0_g1~~TRINITY_DN36037_c0_g1_i1.p1  ORF type:complete len:920 (+),score=238.43 TRINITY_DN36037_c0_g1_i1:121-2880(+)
MSFDPVILGVLGQACITTCSCGAHFKELAASCEKCGLARPSKELQLFELVRVVHKTKEGIMCYLCLGKHGLFFVSKEMGLLVEGKTLSYLHIEKAITDKDTNRFFLLKLTYQREPDWDSEVILIESQHRELLLDRLALCWQAEYMFRRFQVEKFPQAKARITEQLAVTSNQRNIDNLQVQPFVGYEGYMAPEYLDANGTKKNDRFNNTFKHRGYSFFLRSGFGSASGLKQGTYVHETGWEVIYNAQPVVVPGGIQITMHVQDPVPMMDLEKSATGADDIRTVASEYKQAITERLDQFYIMVNCAYMKRMNRTNDQASWDGWEFLIRSKEFVFVCIFFRREYIPPMCDITQDIAVLMRCPAQNMRYDTCEVLLDECRTVADSLACTAEAKVTYDTIIQARLDALQFNEEAYRWLEGRLNLTPCHRKPAAVKFLKSIVQILREDGGLALDEGLIHHPIFKDIPVLQNPLLVPQEMLADAESLMGPADDKDGRTERRNAWYSRISRYLAYCLDGGLVGDRFTLGNIVGAIGKCAMETDKIMKSVLEFLLHVTPREGATTLHGRIQLSQLLQSPADFGLCTFNERVMRVLLTEGYIQDEWKRKRHSGTGGASYEKLLATLLTNDHVGIGLRTLICRQILESTQPPGNKDDEAESRIEVLVPALVKVLDCGNLSLASCATAALVNLSFGMPSTKTLLVTCGVLKVCIRQLKAKDDDLTLYTLYLLVNLTKTPHHRAIVVREGGVPILVNILTSSYQNLRKQKILTEVAGVIGQLCNDRDTRNLMSEDFPVVLCLLWVFDAAQPNTKLKSKLLFALRQLCVLPQNKIKVGGHVIPTVIEELTSANPREEECTTNAILLLTMCASIGSNAKAMMKEDRLEAALEACQLQKGRGAQARHAKFSPPLWDKVLILKERVQEAIVASGSS